MHDGQLLRSVVCTSKEFLAFFFVFLFDPFRTLGINMG